MEKRISWVIDKGDYTVSPLTLCVMGDWSEAEVVKLRKKGYSYSQIRARFRISERTIARILRKHNLIEEKRR